MPFDGTFLVDWFPVTFDALVVVLCSVCAVGTTVVLLEGGDFTSFAICLELFLGVKTADSFGFSFLVPTESFLFGECVERVRPLDGEGAVSSTDL